MRFYQFLMWLLELLGIAEKPLPQPGQPKLHLTKEVGMSLKFTVQLPVVPTPSDIVSQELTVEIAGKQLDVISVGADVTSVENELFVGEDNDEVKLSLAYVDDANNVSPPSEATAILVDTVAPPQPGVLTLVVTEEVFLEEEEETTPEEPSEEDPTDDSGEEQSSEEEGSTPDESSDETAPDEGGEEPAPSEDEENQSGTV